MQHRFTILPAFLLLAFSVFAQISEPGVPLSFQPEYAGVFQKKVPVPVSLPSLNVSKAFQEDGQTPGQTRFAAPLSADISLEKNGVWATLPNGDRVWRCPLTSPKALGLLLFFDAFRLPVGGRFFAYSADRQHVFGAYTAQSCTPSGHFLIGVLPGETVWMEYWEPLAVKGQGQIHLNRVDYAYDANALYEGQSQADNFGQSLACNVNVNCTAGANFQTEKKRRRPDFNGVQQRLCLVQRLSGRQHRWRWYPILPFCPPLPDHHRQCRTEFFDVALRFRL